MEIPHLLRKIRKQGIDLRVLNDSLELVSEQESIDDATVSLIKDHKKDIIDYLRTITVENRMEQIPKASGTDDHPITSTQFRFWILCQLEEINVAYNMPLVVKITGDLKVDLLTGAFDQLIDRHEILRTKFVQQKNGVLNQRILNLKDLDFQLQSIEATSSEKIHEVISKLVSTPFNLKAAPLFRAHLISASKEEQYLCFTIHHIICDGISLGILLKELQEFYNALVDEKEQTLPPLRLQFKDYSEWINNKDNIHSEEKHWLDTFSTEIPVLNLPIYQARPHIKTYRGSTHSHVFTKDLLKKVKNFTTDNQGTLFMALMAAVNGLFFRYTSQTDIVLGTPVSGRNNPDLDGQIGLYINTLPIRTQFAANNSFGELYGIQKKVLQGAYKNANYPFGELVGNLDVQRDISRSPLFDVLVTFQQGDGLRSKQAAFTNLDCSIYTEFDNTTSKYDLTFGFSEEEDQLGLFIEYNTDLFQSEFVHSMAANFESFLLACIENASEEIQNLNYLDAKQTRQLLHTFNDTKVAYDPTENVISSFQKQVTINPNSVAFICQENEISYKELDERSTRLAGHLRQMGVTSTDIVGICLERSLEMMIGMLAILKSGAAYLPLDPFYPLDRIDYIIDHSETRFILAKGKTRDLLPNSSEVIDLADPEIWNVPNDPEPQPIESNATAYVIYTSGSTGKPKGVSVSHRNLMNFMVAMDDKFTPSKAAKVWLAITSISFDISALELLWTLTRGDKVVIHLERPVPITSKPKMDFSLFYFPTGESEETDKYKLLIEGAKFADEHGLKAIWVPERHFHSFGDQFPNPSIAAAAVSTVTQNIKLRSGSVVLPLHDPVRVAEEWSMIDNFSNGRVELSIASGWHPNDFVLAPGDFEDRHQIMREKINTLVDLWEGKPITRKNGVGKDFEFSIHPRPIQAKLPLWITAAGGVETFKYAGTIGANVLTHLMRHTIDELGEKVQVYRKALKDNGFDPKEGKVAIMLHTFVSDDENYVKETVEKPFKNYLRNSVNLLSPIAADQGLSVDDDLDTLLEMGFIRYYNTSSLFGTPESCLDIINKLHKIEIDEIACLIDFGVEKDVVLSNFGHLHRLQELVRRSKLQFDFMSERMDLLDGKESSVALIHSHDVTHMQSTPSFYEELVLQEEGQAALQKIETLLVGGEALKNSLASKLLDVRNKPLHNMYGPTETTIWSAVKRVSNDDPVTIGSPIANTQIYILDPNHKLCPVGVPGELCIGGDGVAQGYLNNKNLTNSRFIENPFSTGQKVYKTGDLARWLPNGELEFLGRLDSQVKIKGHRIELKEIENVILELAAIDQCVVTTTDHKDQTVLVGYAKTAQPTKEDTIKDYLRTKLPSYMIPQQIAIVDDFPYTPNGKIDVQKLSRIKKNKESEKKHAAPRNKLESKLAQLWKDFLKLEELSIDDNFFEIGGNSMKAFQLLSVLNTSLDLELKIISFFQYPTVRTLAQSISERQKEDSKVVVENEMENVDDLIDFMTDL